MGHKTDRIRELEGELTAARLLLRHIGDTVGVEIEMPTTAAEAVREHQRFLEALRGARPVDWDKAKTTSREALRDFEATHLNPPRRSKPAAPGSWDTFDEHVDEQIDRLSEQGLTTPPSRGGALVRSDDVATDFTLDDLDAMHRSTIRDIARELGLALQGNHDDVDRLQAIYAEILRLKNIGADIAAPSTNKALAKGDSLAQAIEHGHAQTADLRDGATQARMIVNRIAAVMQIGKWDADGTELLERAQRWENWKHELKQRIRVLRTAFGSAASEDSRLNRHIADELDRHLARLMAPKELADWLMANERAGVTVKVEAGPTVPPYPFEFRSGDIVPILAALESRADVTIIEKLGTTRTEGLVTAFRDISLSRVSTDEFARTMNAVILPILARQRAAQRLPEDATDPATK